MRRLWRVRHQERRGDLFVARGQRTIDVVAALILVAIVALVVAGVVGIVHVLVWAWTSGAPWFVRGLVGLSVTAIVSIGIAGIRAVLDL